MPVPPHNPDVQHPPIGKKRRRHDYHGKHQAKPAPGKWTEEQIQQLTNWMYDMVSWGQDVRDDIIRLEAAAGLAPGDPGDPPPPPWEM